MRDRLLAVAVAAAAVSSAAARAHSTEGAAAPAAAPAQTNPATPQRPIAAAAQKRIDALRLLVDRDPGDVKSWIALGNEYFDSEQRGKAIEAYGKALKLRPDDPDVLTDQGVMYREIGQHDKAIANFEKASKIDPKHVQSLLDLGILYAQDVKDVDKARKSWQRVLSVAPASRQAERARQYIEQLEQAPKAK